MSELDALAAAPLFEGLAQEDLAGIARVMRRREMAPGDVLWQQGADARGLALVVDARVAVTLRLPGGRSVQLADVGPGETLGELPLIDGGPHSATAQVTQAGSVLFFSRTDFAPFVAHDDPSAFALKRRLVTVNATRLRRQLALLAASLGGDAPAAAPVRSALEPADPPEGAYVRRMATFRSVDSAVFGQFLAAGRFVRCARGTTLEEENGPPAAFFLVVNGTVERVVARADRRIRIGLAGPGQAFGYEGLVDGLPAPATAIARERALLLVLEPAAFAELFAGGDAHSLAFLDVVNRDLAGWLRRAIRPQAQLAVRPIT